MSKERPILFTGPMVRAILDGRKTMTRRVVRGQSPASPAAVGTLTASVVGGTRFTLGPHLAWVADDAAVRARGASEIRCPYGAPGDRLWVRETWRCSFGASAETFYAADLSEYDRKEKGPWRPGIHMPRALCRLTLDVLAVRVERLHDITEDDARAEGIRQLTKDGATMKYAVLDDGDISTTPWVDMARTARDAFAKAWAAMHGAGSWDANPWVWVVTFRRAEVTA